MSTSSRSLVKTLQSLPMLRRERLEKFAMSRVEGSGEKHQPCCSFSSPLSFNSVSCLCVPTPKTPCPSPLRPPVRLPSFLLFFRLSGDSIKLCRKRRRRCLFCAATERERERAGTGEGREERGLWKTVGRCLAQCDARDTIKKQFTFVISPRDRPSKRHRLQAREKCN